MSAAKQFLTHLSKRVSLNDHECSILLSHFSERKLRKKALLLRQGEISRFESYVVSGCLRTFTVDEKGEEHVVALAVNDWWVGDMYSFLTLKPSTYHIEALEDSVLLQVSKEDLEHLYAAVPTLERFFRLLLQNAYIAQRDRIQRDLSMNAEQKFMDFMQRYPDLASRIPQKHLASYLGLTPVFFSVLRKRYSEGLIKPV